AVPPLRDAVPRLRGGFPSRRPAAGGDFPVGLDPVHGVARCRVGGRGRGGGVGLGRAVELAEVFGELDADVAGDLVEGRDGAGHAGEEVRGAGFAIRALAAVPDGDLVDL